MAVWALQAQGTGTKKYRPRHENHPPPPNKANASLGFANKMRKGWVG
jgi:hypothetical protein